MNKHLQTEIELIKLKGRFLRLLLQGFTDERLQQLTPSPSPSKVKELLIKIGKNYIELVQSN